MLINKRKIRSGFIATMLLISMLATSCQKITANGEQIAETRKLSSFEHINVNGSEAVVVLPSDENKVTIVGSSNLIPIYETEVRNGTLYLSMGDKHYNVKKDDILVTVFVKRFSSVKLNGSGYVEVGSFPNLNSLTASVNGSGELKIKLNKFNTIKLQQNGSGNLNAASAVADSVTANLSGSGNVNVYAVKFLDATVAGSGEIGYKGSPAIKSTVSGSGGIRKLN